jgi:hypothetical protein
MSKAEKLAAKILSAKSDKNFAFNDLCYVLERAGFSITRWKGKPPNLLQTRNCRDSECTATQREGETISSKTGARIDSKV